MNQNIVEKIRNELKEVSSIKVKESGERFFKEDVKIYGVKSAVVQKIAKENFKIVKDLGKEKIYEICEQFWKSGYLEESFVACSWVYSLRKEYDKNDMKIFERWINLYISNWASCDTFCNHSVGTLVEMFPELLKELKLLTKSSNRWVRRASAVSLIVPARRGKFLDEVFEIADELLLDGDDMVQKGYGWMLKVAAGPHLNEVFDFVMKRKDKMPRTALRYAIEKMPKEYKIQVMKKEI